MASLHNAQVTHLQWSNSIFFFIFTREIEYLKKETQRCAQVGAEDSALTEESGELQEQVDDAPAAGLQNVSIWDYYISACVAKCPIEFLSIQILIMFWTKWIMWRTPSVSQPVWQESCLPPSGVLLHRLKQKNDTVFSGPSGPGVQFISVLQHPVCLL